jgi:hypothetical protein
MTTTLASISSARRTSVQDALGKHVVLLLAGAVVLARLPFLGRALGKDEAGYLMIGQQWQHAGTSLYGNYWVDRPPLLITIFRSAALTGGTVPLRLIGCLAAGLLVLGSAHVARQLAGDRAARWAAVCAAVMCVSPWLGAFEVNGELLSAPFVVGGFAATLLALRLPERGRALAAAGLAGMAMVAAVMVKQNIADVGVFATVAFVLAWRRGEVTGRRLGGIVAGFGAGVAFGLGVMAAWTLLHGTSLYGVFDAMYPFRVEAGRVMASSNRQGANARLWLLLVSWLISGGAIIMAVITWALMSRRLRGTAAWALVATLVFDVASVILGGNYWHHYLIQLVGPVSILAGVLVARRQPGTRLVLTAAAVTTALTWAVVVPGPTTSTGSTLGHAVAEVAAPSDTIVTLYGNADVTQTSGLSSPYPYLWSLPARILDPRLDTLDRVLRSPSAPTWFVAWTDLRQWSPGVASTVRWVQRHYHPVATYGSHTVYLRNGVQRAAPLLPGVSSPTTTTPATEENLP